ncbi:MAG: four helix bundle protein, partial [Bacteroidia bacterium]|nr:four helix bundle protein [Bacteroidia bacterium]
WQKSHKLVLEIYKLTSQFPKEEIYGLTSQIRRAAVSVPANITEGFKRKGKADKARFFNIAQASLEEVRYFLILTKDLNYAETNAIQERSSEISKMLTRYIKSILNS